jgi:hypothetical protein
MLGSSILIELRVPLGSPSCNGNRMVQVRHGDIHVEMDSTEPSGTLLEDREVRRIIILATIGSQHCIC